MAEWIKVCDQGDLQPNSGVCALVAGKQIAIFYLVRRNLIYAIDNFDPIGKANVLARGIVGDLKGQLVVASPLYKQHFNLQTGACLEDGAISVKTYPVRINSGTVEIQLLAGCGIANEKQQGEAA